MDTATLPLSPSELLSGRSCLAEFHFNQLLTPLGSLQVVLLVPLVLGKHT